MACDEAAVYLVFVEREAFAWSDGFTWGYVKEQQKYPADILFCGISLL